jgi:hypothetical protein
MFQYAAARTLAERVGCRLVIAGHTLGRPFGLVGHWLRVDERRSYNGKQQNGLLHRAFGLRPTFVEGRLLEFARPCLRYSIFPRVYSPRRFSPDGEHTYEEFDAEFFDQGSGTWLSGWYQAEGYFRANSERVREWFQPTAADALVFFDDAVLPLGDVAQYVNPQEKLQVVLGFHALIEGAGDGFFTDVAVAGVPEPGVASLLAAGALGAAALRRKRASSAPRG